jgi:hypothetical protein
MRSLSVRLGLFLVVVAILSPYNSFAEIEVKYDRFKNKTVVQTNPKKTTGTAIQPALVLMASYDGQTPSRPGESTIAFAVRSPKWAYLRCHSVHCLADGKPLELPSFKHHGEVGRGYVFEFISTSIPFSIIEQLSKCEKIEFKLCNTEFSLSRYEMEDLKTFVQAFTEKR